MEGRQNEGKKDEETGQGERSSKSKRKNAMKGQWISKEGGKGKPKVGEAADEQLVSDKVIWYPPHYQTPPKKGVSVEDIEENLKNTLVHNFHGLLYDLKLSLKLSAMRNELDGNIMDEGNALVTSLNGIDFTVRQNGMIVMETSNEADALVIVEKVREAYVAIASTEHQPLPSENITPFVMGELNLGVTQDIRALIMSNDEVSGDPTRKMCTYKCVHKGPPSVEATFRIKESGRVTFECTANELEEFFIKKLSALDGLKSIRKDA